MVQSTMLTTTLLFFICLFAFVNLINSLIIISMYVQIVTKIQQLDWLLKKQKYHPWRKKKPTLMPTQKVHGACPTYRIALYLYHIVFF